MDHAEVIAKDESLKKNSRTQASTLPYCLLKQVKVMKEVSHG